MSVLMQIRQSQLAAELGQAWRWWRDELADLVPPRLRGSRRGSAVDVIPSPAGIELDVVADGSGRTLLEERPLESLDDESWEEIEKLASAARTRIVLRAPDCFITTLRLPPAARGRLRAAIALQLVHSAPVEPDRLSWGIGAVEAAADALLVEVAMARTSRVDALQALFEEHGLGRPPIFAEGATGPVQLAPGRKPASARSRFDRGAWPIAALLIASVPVTTYLGARLELASLEGRIAELQREAAPRLRAEAEARRAESLRRNLRMVAGRPTVSQTVEDLALRLPPSDHIRAAEQLPDRTLRVAVDSRDADALQAALASSPLLGRATVEDLVPSGDGRLSASLRTPPL